MWQAVFGKDDRTEIDLEALFQMHVAIMIKALDPKLPTSAAQDAMPNGSQQ